MRIIGINIRRRREDRKLTLRNLADKIGVTASFLSQIENNKTSPSLSTLKGIADALMTTVASLIGEDQQLKIDPVTRVKDRASLDRIDNGIEMFLLTSQDQNKQMEPLLFNMAEGAHSGNTLYQHYGQEFIFVVKGKLEITLNDTTHIIGKGDTMYFNSHTPHSFKNIHPGETTVLWVVTPPSF